MLLGYLGLKLEVVPGMRIVVVPTETSCHFFVFFWLLLSCGGISDGSSGSAKMHKFKFSSPIFVYQIVSKHQNVYAANLCLISVQFLFNCF